MESVKYSRRYVHLKFGEIQMDFEDFLSWFLDQNFWNFELISWYGIGENITNFKLIVLQAQKELGAQILEAKQSFYELAVVKIWALNSSWAPRTSNVKFASISDSHIKISRFFGRIFDPKIKTDLIMVSYLKSIWIPPNFKWTYLREYWTDFNNFWRVEKLIIFSFQWAWFR